MNQLKAEEERTITNAVKEWKLKKSYSSRLKKQEERLNALMEKIEEGEESQEETNRASERILIEDGEHITFGDDHPNMSQEEDRDLIGYDVNVVPSPVHALAVVESVHYPAAEVLVEEELIHYEIGVTTQQRKSIINDKFAQAARINEKIASAIQNSFKSRSAGIEEESVVDRIQAKFAELEEPDESYENEIPVVQKQIPQAARVDIVDELRVQSAETNSRQQLENLLRAAAVDYGYEEELRQIELLQAQLDKENA